MTKITIKLTRNWNNRNIFDIFYESEKMELKDINKLKWVKAQLDSIIDANIEKFKKKRPKKK